MGETMASRHATWLPAAAVLLAAAAGAFVLQRTEPTATQSWDVLETLVGWTFVGSGAYVWHRRATSPLGPLLVAAGLLYATGRVLRQFDVDAAFTAGILIGDLWTVLFVWVMLAFPDGRLRATLDPVVLGLVFFAVGPLELLWLLFWNPSIHPANAMAVWPNDRIASDVDTAQRALLCVSAVALTVVLVRRWSAASRPLRWALLPALVGAVALLVGSSINILENAAVAVPTELRWTLLLTIAMVPVAVMVGALRVHLARAGIAQLLLQLRDASPTVDLPAMLAHALGDPSLHLAYWLPQFGYYADADGRPAALSDPHPGRATTYIDRSGARIAAIEHDAALSAEPELLDAVAVAAGMTLQNGQLQAELKARLEELEGSRARIVEAGQDERKRLERNLHDGTQQRLVVLAMELSVLERKLSDDPDARARVAHARTEVAASLADLREVARGLYPAVLTQHGLMAALRSLVARAGLPVRLRTELGGRLPEPVEVTAYYLVSEALANIGKHAHATSAAVVAVVSEDVLTVEIVDDGVGAVDLAGGSGLRGLRDRVDAVGGVLVVAADRNVGTRVWASIPCGSKPAR